jgi:hypothetical protein
MNTSDRVCDRCGKVPQIPFGKEGDPLLGNFDGLYLVKNFRPMCEEDMPEYDKIINELELDDYSQNVFEKVESKYSKEKVDKALLYDQLRNTIGSTYECRDCHIQ